MNRAVVYRTGIVMAALAVLAVFATAPALAHVDVYFSPEPSTLDLAVGENVTVQLLAYVDANETNGFSTFQIGIDYNPNVVNITKCENPCKQWIGPPYNVCLEEWWEPDHDGTWKTGEYGEWIGPYGEWLWITAMDEEGYDAPLTVPLANLTIERVAPGDMYLDISPLEFTHDLRFGSTGGKSRLFDKNNKRIDETRITWHDTFERRLYAGWNLISLPLEPPGNESVSEVLKTVSYDKVYSYNASSDEFEELGPSDTMEPGVGYFVNLTADGIWRYSGTKLYGYSPIFDYDDGIEMNVQSEPGLNLIGAPCWPIVTSGNITFGDYWYATTFNATAQNYTDTFNPHSEVPAVFNRFTTIEPGMGFWVSAKHACWLNVTVNK